MENAADALKMAAAVLLFVLAISVAIYSFGQVRETADVILDYRDRETVYIDGDYYYKGTETEERQVGVDTIIPTITRAYLENYKIVFNGLNNPLYKINSSETGLSVDKYVIDLETNNTTEAYKYQDVVVGANQKTEFLCGILYGKIKDSNGEYKDIHENAQYKEYFEKTYHIKLTGCDPLYKQLTNIGANKIIKEYVGVYYQNDNQDTSEANKYEKRIITYSIEDKT